MIFKDSNFAIGKNLFMIVMIVLGLFSAVLFLSNSWIKIVIIILIVGMSIVWLVSHGLLRRTLKYALLVVTIFSLSFSAFEGYMLWHVDYPPTFFASQPGVTISYPNILDVSLIEAVQSVKNTLTFKLFMLEHPGETIIDIISLDTANYMGGRIEFILHQQSFNSFFNVGESNSISFSASGGEAYKVYPVPMVTLCANDFPTPQIQPQQQTSNEALEQIDALGIQWYYDRAIEAYQNKTGIIPEINELKIVFCRYGSLGFDGIIYEGSELSILGSFYGSVFYASFQPDGTLNFINILK